MRGDPDLQAGEEAHLSLVCFRGLGSIIMLQRTSWPQGLRLQFVERVLDMVSFGMLCSPW